MKRAWQVATKENVYRLASYMSGEIDDQRNDLRSKRYIAT
jgi:hypothetical protein